MKNEKPKKKKLPMIRINSRIEPSQHRFIKQLAKKTGLSEGKIFRDILEEFIKSNKY